MAVLAGSLSNIGRKEGVVNIYAEVKNGAIISIIDNFHGDSSPLPTQGGEIIDVTRSVPPAAVGQTVNMRSFAIIKDGKVVNVIRWHESTTPVLLGYTVIDVTGVSPIPTIGDTYP